MLIHYLHLLPLSCSALPHLLSVSSKSLRSEMADFLAEKRAEIDNRLKELRPLHEEFLQLEKAKAALDGLDGPRRGPGRPRGSSGATTTRRRRRRRSGGTRGDQALQLVRQNPGATVS